MEKKKIVAKNYLELYLAEKLKREGGCVYWRLITTRNRKNKMLTSPCSYNL